MIKLIMHLKNLNIYLLLNMFIMLNLNKCKCQNIVILLYFMIKKFFFMCYFETNCIKMMINVKNVKTVFFLYYNIY